MHSKIHNPPIGIDRLKVLAEQINQEQIGFDDAVDLVVSEFDLHLLEIFYGGADKSFEEFMDNYDEEITSWVWELVEGAADILEV